ncbi:MAG: hypothetical protein WBJ13_14285 [Sedimentibacter sp.]
MIEDNIKSNLDEVYVILKDNMELCFKHLESNPNDTKKILSIWKNYSDKIYKEFLHMSNMYDNDVVGKEITKMLIFK